MKSALIQLHLAVFLWGFTGVLGRAISLNEMLLVWYRLIITISILIALLIWKKELPKLSTKTIIRLLLIGGVVAVHWVLFYGSIKYSNISIGLICLSSSALMTAFLEPLILRRKWLANEVLLGLMSIAGIYLIFHFDSQYRTGIIIGIISTFCSALFSILNKKIVSDIASKDMMLFELLGGFIWVSLLLPFYLKIFPTTHLFPSTPDWIWLIILSWVCTVWAMNLSLMALKKISAFTQNLTLNLEPVYGIILAFAIYHENKFLSNTFYWGLGLIFLSVLLQMMKLMKRNKLPDTVHLH